MRVGSLCSGIGGIELGLSTVEPVTVAWHSEVDPAACRVLEAHWPGVANLGDLRAVDWAAVEPVDLLTAGYPCQPFSHAGRRGGADDPRHLWPAVACAVRVLRPRRVLLENVAGHLSLGFGDVLGDLAEAGFDAEWCCVRSSDVGAPHRRERVFIVAADTEHVGWDGPAVGRGVGQSEGERRVLQPQGRTAAAAAHALSERLEGSEPEPEPRHVASVGALARHEGGQAPPDADGEGLEGHGRPVQRARELPAPAGHQRFGSYRAAVGRWEAVHGPAPDPTGEGKLSPAFVEWMLGYPPGWTDPAGSRNARLRCLGNSVQPQVAALAWTTLTEQVAA